jgi:catechol 2,3-dioxygenase-like lactoylglutathione lyase family enzyme
MTATPKTAGPGLPGAQCVDHVAFTVPNLDAAIAFGRDALGADLIYRLPPLSHGDGWMERKLDVHPRAVTEIALLRLGPTTNVELFEYHSPGRDVAPRRPSSTGALHLGLQVDDLELALPALSKHEGVRALGPVPAGAAWVRVENPWGIPLELRARPTLLRYREQHGEEHAAAEGPLPGFRQVDHLAYSVPDLARAEDFFARVLGAEPIGHETLDLTEPGLAESLGVPSGGVLERALLRLGPLDTLELSCLRGPTHPATDSPRNDDVGGRHLALHVTDVDAAAAALGAEPGCTVLGEPETIPDGPIAGDRWVYVRTYLGLHIEVVRMPDGELPYERETTARRRPAGSLRWADR